MPLTNINTTIEYDDGIEDTPMTRKHKPAEPWMSRRGRKRGFYLGKFEIPVGYMRRSEMAKLSAMLREWLLDSCGTIVSGGISNASSEVS